MGVVELIDFLITAFFGREAVPPAVHDAIRATPGATEMAREIAVAVDSEPGEAARKILRLAEAIHPRVSGE